MKEIRVNEIISTYEEKYQQRIKMRIFFNSMYGNEEAPKTDEEFQAFCNKVVEDVNEEERKEEEKKQKKIAKEKAKAESLQLTYEEYKQFEKLIKNKKRYESEIRKAKRQIEELQQTICYYEKKIEATKKEDRNI